MTTSILLIVLASCILSFSLGIYSLLNYKTYSYTKPNEIYTTALYPDGLPVYYNQAAEGSATASMMAGLFDAYPDELVGKPQADWTLPEGEDQVPFATFVNNLALTIPDEDDNAGSYFVDLSESTVNGETSYQL